MIFGIITDNLNIEKLTVIFFQKNVFLPKFGQKRPGIGPKLDFDMQINIEVFYKVILSLWVSVTRHAQSTQNKFAYFCNISIKAWGMKLIFYL